MSNPSINQIIMNVNRAKIASIKAVFSKLINNSAPSIWNKFQANDRSTLYQYVQYKKGKISLSPDDANSLQMEVICSLADIVLEAEFGKTGEEMVDSNGSFYEEYQDRFNDLYDDLEDKLLNYDFTKKIERIYNG